MIACPMEPSLKSLPFPTNNILSRSMSDTRSQVIFCCDLGIGYIKAGRIYVLVLYYQFDIIFDNLRCSLDQSHLLSLGICFFFLMVIDHCG